MRRNDDNVVKSLSMYQKFALMQNSHMSQREIKEISDGDINYNFFLKHNVRPSNIFAAKLSASDLHARGVDNAFALKRLGFDALDLSASFASQCVFLFGEYSMREAFLVNEIDAVNLAGSETCRILNIDSQMLLENCAGCPVEAKGVLLQLDIDSALVGVDVSVLKHTGIRAKALRELGFSLPLVLRQIPEAKPADIVALGFTL